MNKLWKESIFLCSVNGWRREKGQKRQCQHKKTRKTISEGFSSQKSFSSTCWFSIMNQFSNLNHSETISLFAFDTKWEKSSQSICWIFFNDETKKLTTIELVLCSIFRELRRKQWCKLIVALSAKYSLAERWDSVSKWRIIFSWSARVQWQKSQTKTCDHEELWTVDSSINAKFSGQLTQKCRKLSSGSSAKEKKDFSFQFFVENLFFFFTDPILFEIVMNRRNSEENFVRNRVRTFLFSIKF